MFAGGSQNVSSLFAGGSQNVSSLIPGGSQNVSSLFAGGSQRPSIRLNMITGIRIFHHSAASRFPQETDKKAAQDKLSHVDEQGKASMVDVDHKPESTRVATAQGKVFLGPVAFRRVLENKIKKGDVLTVAQLAGIQAAKQTGYLIPLCHPLLLSMIKVDLKPCSTQEAILITATVKCSGKTGVEMEAITAVSIAACTVYDMCKAVNKGIEIGEIKLIQKQGGMGGDYRSP